MTHAGMIGRTTIEAGSYLPRSGRGHGKKSAVAPIGRPRVRTYDIMRSGGSSHQPKESFAAVPPTMFVMSAAAMRPRQWTVNVSSA